MAAFDPAPGHLKFTYMQENHIVEAKIVNLDALFSGQISYQIPQFQRPYEWREEEQWMPLWEDVRTVAERLMESKDTKIRPHFMGAIVLQHRQSATAKVDKSLVVDGQQRLTSLQLLIRAAHWVFQSVNDDARVDRLRTLTENQESHLDGNPDNRTKIRQSNHLDQKAFYEAIIMLDAFSQSDFTKISSAYKFFKSRVEQWLRDDLQSMEHKSDALEKALKEGLELAVIDLDADEKPHIIFETLNARGEPLKQSDLVKNTVMYEANVIDDASTAMELWGMFEDTWWRESTGETRDRIQLDRFLNHWMIMKLRREVSPQRVAAEFRGYIRNSQGTDIKATTSNIKSTGVIYKNFLAAKHRDKRIVTFLQRMQVLDIAATMPFLLWLETSDRPPEQVKQCFLMLESFLIRRTLCGLISHGIGGFLAELLNRFNEQPRTSCASIMVDYMGSSTTDSTIWPHNRMLNERLLSRPLRGTVARRKMILEAIEDHIRGEKTEEILFTKKLTLEHIMPKKWEAHWRFRQGKPTPEDRERRDEMVNFLGNLTLTTGSLNKHLSNGSWRQKHKALKKHATLLLTGNLVSAYPHHFDEDSIMTRTQEMASHIAEIWKPCDHYRY